ncbi:MAG: DUF6119 family protein [Xanthomonadales bacterium]|nr:DUF6119 family protein [Xanthomonadales bacterium]
MPNLTIYLLRDEFTTAASAIDGLASEHSIKTEGATLGTLYVRDMPERYPSWVGLFAELTDASLFDRVRSTAALYITEAGGRLFALAFGHGRHLLKPGAFEERFGLLVVINTLKSDELRSIDKRTFDTVDQNVRAQVSQRSPATEFGIDIEKDLIRGITGQPKDPLLGTRMTGSDSLVVSVETTIDDLGGLLDRYLEAFKSNAYLDGFAWIDQIHQVGDKTPIRNELDQKLVERMAEAQSSGGHAKGLWLAIPDVVDYAGIHRFRFTGSSSSHNDLHLPGFIRALEANEPITLDLLRKKHAFAVDSDGHEVGDKWPIYKCIHFEIDVDDQTYLLAAGKWFCIRRAFTDEVNQFYDNIPTLDLGWMEYQHESEGAYNQAVAAASNGSYALMDAVPISVGGLRDRIEFCDLYSTCGQLVHVKRYGAASLLGHLFNQGLVAGEHLRSDERFLTELNKKLPPTHILSMDDAIPRPVDGFSIVFAIISEWQGDGLHIPFFAKVAFKNACTRLRSLGYVNIAKAKITVDECFSKTEKLKTKKAKAKKTTAKELAVLDMMAAEVGSSVASKKVVVKSPPK